MKGDGEMIASLMFKRKVRSGFKMFERGDVAGMMASWADDIVFESLSAQGAAVAVEGKKAAEELIRKWFEEWPKLKLTLKNICIREVFPLLAAITGTSVIMAEMSVTQTHKTGKEFRYDTVEVYHVRKGKVIRITDYFSTLGLAEVEAARKLGGKT
jgi:ketosteroid isomerase-like protein